MASRTAPGPTGFELPLCPGAGAIPVRLDPARWASLGDEGYLLAARASGVTITAAADAGLFWGAQTLRQLLPPQVESAAKARGVDWTAPGVSIEDRSRFAGVAVTSTWAATSSPSSS